MLDDDYYTCSSDDYESFDNSYNSSLSDSEPLGNKLLQVFDKKSSFLSMVHINAQSLMAHYSDLLTSFSTNTVDCIMVSETWLKPSIPSTSCSLPGFQLFRADRTDRSGGGVGIYLRSEIPGSVVSKTTCESTGTLEYLFLEIIINHKKVLLGAIYCPNDKINYFNILEGILESLVPSYDHVICMGDLNTCLLKNDVRAQSLQSLISSVNMQILPLSNPTHYFPNCRPSLIDLIFVSNPDLAISHGQMTAPFSHHDLIFLAYKVRPPKVRGKVVLKRNFKHMDLERLREDVKKINWSSILATNNVDIMVDSLTAVAQH